MMAVTMAVMMIFGALQKFIDVSFFGAFTPLAGSQLISLPGALEHGQQPAALAILRQLLTHHVPDSQAVVGRRPWGRPSLQNRHQLLGLLRQPGQGLAGAGFRARMFQGPPLREVLPQNLLLAPLLLRFPEARLVLQPPVLDHVVHLLALPEPLQPQQLQGLGGLVPALQEPLHQVRLRQKEHVALHLTLISLPDALANGDPLNGLAQVPGLNPLLPQ